MLYDDLNINTLVGKTLISVTGKKGGNEIVFETTDGEKYKLYHYQDCCEAVYVEDICGDLEDLVGTPIVTADENSKKGENSDWDTFTWTFYNIRTIKGTVTIRFYGTSNGYYSERVDFVRVKTPNV